MSSNYSLAQIVLLAGLRVRLACPFAMTGLKSVLSTYSYLELY